MRLFSLISLMLTKSTFFVKHNVLFMFDKNTIFYHHS